MKNGPAQSTLAAQTKIPADALDSKKDSEQTGKIAALRK
jgi:hypothetical protein